MSRYSMTLLGLVLMTAFGIFFGIEIATRGMERIQGPVTGIDGGVVESSAPNGNSANAGRNPQTNVRGTPQPAAQGTTGALPGKTTQSAARPTPIPTPTPLPPIGAGVPSYQNDSGVNRLGNGIGNILQGAAHETIRTVVGLFDGLVN